MTEIEKAIVKSLADLARFSTELGKTQYKMANFIVHHQDNLSEPEKQEMLEAASTSWQQTQSFQEIAKSLSDLIK